MTIPNSGWDDDDAIEAYNDDYVDAYDFDFNHHDQCWQMYVFAMCRCDVILLSPHLSKHHALWFLGIDLIKTIGNVCRVVRGEER